MCVWTLMYVFFQAEDGRRDLVRSRGLGDVYKRQAKRWHGHVYGAVAVERDRHERVGKHQRRDEYNL